MSRRGEPVRPRALGTSQSAEQNVHTTYARGAGREKVLRRGASASARPLAAHAGAGAAVFDARAGVAVGLLGAVRGRAGATRPAAVREAVEAIGRWHLRVTCRAPGPFAPRDRAERA